MDMMELRRRLMFFMAGGGTDISPWKVMKVTASENHTKADTIKTWLDAVIPNSDYIWLFKDRPVLDYLVMQNEFIGIEYIQGATNMFFRWRGTNLQSRSYFTSTEDALITSGDTFTIFYL